MRKGCNLWKRLPEYARRIRIRGKAGFRRGRDGRVSQNSIGELNILSP